MERIPEPELMTAPDQAKAYAEADFEAPHQVCIEQLKDKLVALPISGTALDLGCGSADITLRFARTFPGWAVDGVDGSPAMLHYGNRAVQAAGLGDRVQLRHSYLPDGDAPRNAYDLIFSNSLLHHLANPSVLWASVHRWAMPHTAVFIMDLRRPDTPAQAAQLVEQYAAQEPDILRHDFYHSLLAAYRVEEVQDQLREARLGHLTVQSVGDRHWILWGYYAP